MFFSAHYDSKNTSNKFGFDKVILVCDIDNIRNIFHAKYGANVDFSGYIDKFYSKEIFKFDNSEMIRKNIKDILESVNVDYDRDNDEDYLDFSDTSKAISLDLVYILEGLIKVNALKIRSLAKLSNIDYPIEPYSISYRGKKMWNTETPICIILNFLKFLFGNETGLKLALQKCCDLEPLDIQDPDDIDDYSGLN
ncbi:MAG: hypothetical protein NVV82_20425 [Sporocytophaga sp.]|nr:hypothetical protein [Sporocytophaga sp.]